MICGDPSRWWPRSSATVLRRGVIVLAIWVVSSAVGAQRPIQTPGEALACARTELGGGKALSALAALTVSFDVVPAPTNTTGQPMATELALTFPDRFTKTDRVRLVGREMTLTRGLIGDKAIDGPSGESLQGARGEFARWALVLLLRDTPAIPLRWAPDVTSDDTHVTLAATGPDGFNMALTLAKATCIPAAVTWNRPPNAGDAQVGRTSTTGRLVERYDLSAYKVFDGIRLPTRIRMAIDTTARFEWTLKSAQVRLKPTDRD